MFEFRAVEVDLTETNDWYSQQFKEIRKVVDEMKGYELYSLTFVEKTSRGTMRFIITFRSAS
jgi:hypothetical protein